MKEVVDASSEILGFDPKSTKEEIFQVEMTPEMAEYILRNHNNSNRKFVKAQQNAIKKSWDKFGWLFDGGVCAFNTDGQLTEFQHSNHLDCNWCKACYLYTDCASKEPHKVGCCL